MKIFKIILVLFIFSSFVSFGSTYYWVGGSGTWSSTDPSHWTLSTGGTGGAGIPTVSDQVIFDTLSSGGISYYNVTFSGNVGCKDMQFYSYGLLNSSFPSFYDDESPGSLTINGSLMFDSGVYWDYYRMIIFASPSTGTVIDLNNQNLDGTVRFDGAGSWDLHSGLFTDPLEFFQGTLNSNDHNIGCASFTMSGSNSKTLNLGSSNISMGGDWNVSGSNIALNGTYTIELNGYSVTQNFYGNGLTYHNLTLDGSYCDYTIHGTNTFNDFVLLQSNNPMTISLYGDISLNELMIEGNSFYQNIFISSGTSVTIHDANGGKNCLFGVHINSVNTLGANFIAYRSSIINTVSASWDTTGLTNMSFPDAGYIYSSISTDNEICQGSTFDIWAMGQSAGFYEWSSASGIMGTSTGLDGLTPDQTTTYTFKVSDVSGNGCFSKATINIFVDSLPAVNAGADQIICGGSTVQLNGSTSAAGVNAYYSWTPSNAITSGSPTVLSVTAAPAVTTTFTLTVNEGHDYCHDGCWLYCPSSDYMDVIVDTYSISAVSPGSGAICPGDSIVLSASGAFAYNWSPATGLNKTSGPTIKASPLANTNYIVSGCLNSIPVNITINALPNIDAGPNTSICLGSSTQLSASGGTQYTWWPATALIPTNSANPVASPQSITKYFVVGTSANGCKNKDSVVVFINYLPTSISAGPDISICPGASATLAASGGVSYTWSPAAGLTSTNTANPNASPQTTSTYIVTGHDANGCSNTDNVTIFIHPASVSGSVSWSQGLLTGNAFVKLYRYDIFSQMMTMDSVGISSGGSYSFENLSYTDTTIVYVEADTLVYPKTAGTYYPNTFEWNKATKVIPSCLTNPANITLVEMQATTGSNTVKGRIVEGVGFGKTDAAGDGIEGVQVGLKKKPGGQLSSNAVTDTTGNYEMDNLPDGSYEIYINMPGLPMIDNYTITLSASNPVENSMNFKVDSNQIETTDLTGIRQFSEKQSSMRIYPNPASDLVYIAVDASSSYLLTIEVVDVLGKTVKTSNNNAVQKGIFFIRLNTSDMTEGVYWLRLKTKDEQRTEKLCIVR